MDKRTDVKELRKAFDRVVSNIDANPYRDMAKAISLIDHIAWEKGIGGKVWDEFSTKMTPPTQKDVHSAKELFEHFASTYESGDSRELFLELESNYVAPLLPKRGKVLDAGCGTGNLTTKLAESAADVTGIDISQEMLRITKEAVKNRDVKLVKMDLRNLRFRDNEFDSVVCSLVLNHLKDWKKAVREIVRVTKPGGKLIVSLIHPIRFGTKKSDLVPFSKTGTRQVWTNEYAIWLSDLLEETGCSLEKMVEVKNKKLADVWGVENSPILLVAQLKIHK